MGGFGPLSRLDRKDCSMPAQIPTMGAKYRSEFDSAPPISDVIKDPEGNPLDLTGPDVSVTITVAFAMPRGTYYTSPRDQIVVRQPCDIDFDQVDNMGLVHWVPGPTEGVDALTPPGNFLYQYEVMHTPTNQRFTYPYNTYLPLVIMTKVGGRSMNP